MWRFGVCERGRFRLPYMRDTPKPAMGRGGDSWCGIVRERGLWTWFSCLPRLTAGDWGAAADNRGGLERGFPESVMVAGGHVGIDAYRRDRVDGCGYDEAPAVMSCSTVTTDAGRLHGDGWRGVVGSRSRASVAPWPCHASAGCCCISCFMVSMAYSAPYLSALSNRVCRPSAPCVSSMSYMVRRVFLSVSPDRVRILSTM